MRAKVAQENIVKSGRVPYTIVRATQFFEFIPALIDGATTGDTARLSPVLMQPIAAADVSATLADVAAREPANEVIELAGPEPLRLAEAATRILRSRGDERTVVTDPDAGYFGGVVDDRSLTPGNDPSVNEHLYGTTRFEDWLDAQSAR
jgi:uncharacterized protein YbjT (DUF2867 family)